MKSKSTPASALVKGTLWVTGGLFGRAGTEFINPNGTVTIGPTLPNERSSHCMIKLHDNKIMLLGGIDSSDEKSVVIFNPESRRKAL